MRQNTWHAPVNGVFLGFLGAFALISLWKPQQGFSQSENRYLQTRPEFSWESLRDGSFGTAYEAYLSDQFPFREGWIGVGTGFRRLQGAGDVNGVYFGKDRYLMERFEREDLEGEVLDRNLEAAAQLLAWAGETLGMDRTRVMLVPSAAQVLKDRLPFLAAPYDQSQITERLGQMLAERLGQEAAAGLMVPAEEALAAHSREPIYYRTDHHWTALGAYRGYEAWAESAGFAAWPREDFTVKTVSDSFLGTIYSKVNIPWPADAIQAYLPAEGPAYTVYYDGAETPGGLYNYGALEGKDQYSFYMDGNHGLTRAVRKEAAPEAEGAGRRILLVKDSYAHAMAPFVMNHFEELHMIDLRYYNGDIRAYIQEQGITDLLVLYGIPQFAAERTAAKMR